MAISQDSFNNGEDEEYIDMDVSSLSSSKFLCSPPQRREFEFQMCSFDIKGEITSNSPADELFYKGKLLPLHLPPRLQMVQKLVQSSKIEVPFEANSVISPLESCRASCDELNPDDDCFIEWSDSTSNNISNKSWSKKLKNMKQSSIITQKLKASREYLKSLFSKSGCSDESCAKAASCTAKGENVSKMNKYVKMAKKKPFGSSSIEGDLAENVADIHRRSYSGVIQRHSAATNSSSSSSSTSFSFSSSGYCNSIENSIEGAIAHCKQSQKLGVCSISAVSKISVCGDQERSQLCRI